MFQDAIYLSFAFRTRVEECRMQACGRYGLHTMYCQENRVLANVFTRNEAGCALMFTNRLQAIGNDFIHNRGPRTYGLLLRDCSDGEFRDNRLVDNTIGAFLDNSNRNRFAGNLVQDNGWGLFIFSSCDNNEVAGNTFLNNDYPVSLDMRRTDNRFDDGKRGNFWSQNAPYDLDADGVSDVPFSPVTAFAFHNRKKCAQQCVQRTAGSLRDLQAVFWLRVFSALKQDPPLRPLAATDNLQCQGVA